MKEKIFFSFLFNIISNLIYLLSGYLLARNLEVVLLGLWVFLNSTINIGFLFVDIGIDIIHYQYSGKKDISTYFGSYFTLKFILLIFNILVSVIFLILLNLWMNEIFLFFIILLGSKVLFYLANIFLIHLRANLKVFKAEIPSFLIIIFKSTIIIFLSLNLPNINEPILFLCLNNFIFDFVLLILVFILSKNEFELIKPNKSIINSYLIDVKPLVFYSIILVIATYLGDIILDYSFGHEALAFFSIINGYILPVLLLISGSVITVYFSVFSKLFENKNLDLIGKISYLLEKYFSILFLYVIIFVYLNGKELINLFLPNYLEAIPILYIMIFMPYIIAVSRHYPYILISGKKQKMNAIISSINSFLIILLMIFLIPEKIYMIPGFGLGTMGYAIAQTIPWIFWTILNRYFVNKYFNIKLKSNFLLHIPLALISYLLSYILKQILLNFINNVLINVCLSSVISFFIFIFLLFLIKELKKSDIITIKELFRLSIYKESLKEEFKNDFKTLKYKIFK